MSKVSIKDATVRIKPASTMCEFIAELSDLTAMPANVLNIHQLYGGTSSAEQLNTDGAALLKPTLTNDDVAFLKELSVEAAADEDSSSRPIRLADILTITRDDESAAEDDEPADVDDVDADGDEVAAGKTSKTRAKRQKEQRKERQRARARLTLQDLIWLNEVLSERRRHSSSAADGQPAVYLHQLLVGSQLALPRNEIHERDPALEARCVRLRLEQDARVYNAMTKNVDTSRRQLPDDTIAYQMKAINPQMIGVAQFLFSVAAGFAFGFIGVELLIGNLDFGFRLLLGIICALVIALAEIYFLAKQLNEEYDVSVAGNDVLLKAAPAKETAAEATAVAAVKDGSTNRLTPTNRRNKKPHAD